MAPLNALLSVTIGVLEAGVLVHAAATDIACRIIPHRLCVGLAALGLMQRARDHHLIAAIGAGAVVFIIGTVLWRWRWLGGGDVKLMAAACCVVVPVQVPALMVAIAISGGVLAGVYLAVTRLLRRSRMGTGRRQAPAGGGVLMRVARLERWRMSRGHALPYGVAISAGTLVYVFGA